MALPKEADFAIINMGDGATPTELFVPVCGIQDVGINATANTQDRFVRDCAKPALPAVRRSKTTGTQLDITGSGLTNVVQLPLFKAALGRLKNYKITLFEDDGTDTGKLLYTITGRFNLTASNLSTSLGGDASGEFNLANDGPWIEEAAV